MNSELRQTGKDNAAEAPVLPALPSRQRWWRIVGIIALVLLTAALLYWRYASQRETTDDAQIDGPIHLVSARVGGTVVKLQVNDNKYVEAGTLLAQIDPKDYQVAVDRAKADLAEAEANLGANNTQIPIVSVATDSLLSGSKAGVQEVRASISAAEKQVEAAQARLRSATAMVQQAKANDDRAAKDLERMQKLIAKDEISQQQYDASIAAAKASQAQVEAAQAQAQEAEEGVRGARSQLDLQRARLVRAEAEARAAGTGPEQLAATRARAASSQAKVEQMKAVLEQARLNLQYTEVRAPVSGIISQRSVEVGQIVQAGQPLLSIVPLEDIWITANYKENQLRNMRPGQTVTISVDAYGGRVYHGHVDSIAAATGARFSLLPPENATGNFVKVVQRIPVKIVLEKGQDAEHLLRPGMSVVPTVFIH